jgi:hypothetical protein
MTHQFVMYVLAAVFGAGGAWAVQIYRTSSLTADVKALALAVAALPTVEALKALRELMDRMEKRIGEDMARMEKRIDGELTRLSTATSQVNRHLGDVREELADLKGELRGRAAAHKESP